MKVALLNTNRARRDSSAPLYSASEWGDVDTTTIAVTFNENLKSGLDYTTGVTIKKNTVAQTINSGTLQTNAALVYYVVAAAADIDDTFTWEYAPGTITDVAGNALAAVTAQAATNNIGSHFKFNDGQDSGHFCQIYA